jgi:tetratricopeptide (TPR) repeat protein
MSNAPQATLQAAFQQARQLHGQGRLAEAIELYNRLIAVAPNSALVHLSLGVALRATGRSEAAVACHRRSIALDPRNSVAYSNLGNALKDLGRFEEAVAAHDQSLSLDPDNAETFYNKGVALKAAGHLRQALATFEEATRCKSEHYEAQWDRALLLLHLGDLAAGWPAYEYRWKLPHHKQPGFSQPRWQGESLAGKTLLLYPEQGFGDTIQMLRFLPSVAATDGQLVVQIQAELLRLARTSFPELQFIARGEPLPPFDLQCPLMSLPAVFQLKLEQLPGEIPYLRPPAEASEKFHQPLARAGNAIKVGIIWSGSVTFVSNHLRAVPLKRFLSLLEVPGVEFFSLQMGPTRQQLADSGVAGLITDLTPLIEDFADTAAAINQLDLVIMTDSSVAHLTGALGQPIWDLLPHVADWRWLEDRPDSPWYPSMRLFRQQAYNQWDEVFEQLQSELIALAGNR